MSEEKKSEVIENILEKLSRNFEVPRSLAFSQGSCVMCSGEAKEFRDSASKREYKISGMCQSCQDDFFE